MSENWYALCVAILTDKSISDALSAMEIEIDKNKKRNLNLSLEEALEFKRLKDSGARWERLSEPYGISGTALRLQVSKVIRKATKNPDQSVQSSISKQSSTLYHRNEVMQIVS